MKKVARSQYDEELQSYFRSMRLLSWGLSRKWGVKLFNLGVGSMRGNQLTGAHNEEQFHPSLSTPDHHIRVRIFRPEHATERLPAMLYLHGGGYIMGAPEQALSFYEQVLQQRKVAIFAPAYRLADRHPFPAGLNDCYDTLLWMKAHADELNIYPNRFIIAGHSAGGGMTAALTMKARDTREVDVAFQMPVYPMIDHRMITESAQMKGTPVWDASNNRFAWGQYLQGIDHHEVPTYASPALNEDFRGFPPTISFVGTLEPFRDETIAYMEALKQAGVPTMFRVFEGAFHGFETLAPNTRIGQEANRFQLEAFGTHVDRYVNNS